MGGATGFDVAEDARRLTVGWRDHWQLDAEAIEMQDAGLYRLRWPQGDDCGVGLVIWHVRRLSLSRRLAQCNNRGIPRLWH